MRMLVVSAAVTLEEVLLPDNVDGEAIWPSRAAANLWESHEKCQRRVFGELDAF